MSNTAPTSMDETLESAKVHESAIETTLPTPIQGNGDWRSYRVLRLKNGVTVALVQDKASKTVGVAATVLAGAAADPREWSGLGTIRNPSNLMALANKSHGLANVLLREELTILAFPCCLSSFLVC